MTRRWWARFNFQIVVKVAKKPGSFFINESLKHTQGIVPGGIDLSPDAHPQETLLRVGCNSIMMIIEKTKSVEPLCPVQHFLFYFREISYRKRVGQNCCAQCYKPNKPG